MGSIRTLMVGARRAFKRRETSQTKGGSRNRERLLDKIDRYKSAGQLAATLEDADVRPDADGEDEEFAVGGRRQSYRLPEPDVARWRKDLRQDKDTLDAVLLQVAATKPERDGKLREIEQAVRDKAGNPTLDRDGNPNRKLLVFTANYLCDNLAG